MNPSRIDALQVEIEHHVDEAFRLWMRLQDARGIPYPSTMEEAEQFFSACPVKVGHPTLTAAGLQLRLQRYLTESPIR